MKTKIILSTISIGIALIGKAYAASVTCMDCREQIIDVNGTISYGACQQRGEQCCPPCRDFCNPTLCTGDTITDMGDGCDKVATKGCDNGICTTTTTARCQKGYYGAAKLNNLQTSCSGCTACPSSGGISGTTSGPGATAITECYIPAGSKSSDSTGSFEYTGNCYYKN